jgi:hypothetical protein
MAGRTPPIKQKYIKTPEYLWELFCNYVQHERGNPMFKVEYVGKEGDKVNTPLQVPITFEGFECWLADEGIIQDLGDYSKNDDNRYKTYASIITRIQNNCFAQNFKGAAVGLFNANLIAKKLGLVEKKQTELTGSINMPKVPDIGNRE